MNRTAAPVSTIIATVGCCSSPSNWLIAVPVTDRCAVRRPQGPVYVQLSELLKANHLEDALR